MSDIYPGWDPKRMVAPIGTECEHCTDLAFAHCVACAPGAHRFFCRDHWLAHLEAAHSVANETIYNAEVEEEP